MNKNMFELISNLSKADNKSPLEKVVKLSEETGELSRKMLGITQAAANKHRFVLPEHILEEVADVMLVAMSIAIDHGFDQEDIEEMMLEKASKWQSLLKRESKVRKIMAYEIHVTVDKVKDIEAFKQTCKELGVKPIVLALQNEKCEDTEVQLMTSSTLAGGDKEAKDHVAYLETMLALHGFEVVRSKIEAPYWHPAAPMRESGVNEMPNGCYFEAHLNIRVNAESIEEIKSKESELMSICNKHNAHYSRNIFKMKDPLNYTRMATLRAYKGFAEDFNKAVNTFEKSLKFNGFSIEKVITEFSLYDSNVSHDGEWISN